MRVPIGENAHHRNWQFEETRLVRREKSPLKNADKLGISADVNLGDAIITEDNGIHGGGVDVTALFAFPACELCGRHTGRHGSQVM
jgi:hypothetical protein